jgi:hypothetical protein
VNDTRKVKIDAIFETALTALGPFPRINEKASSRVLKVK